MIIKTFTVFSVVALLFLSILSCKKDPLVQPENSLSGSWEELDLNGFKRALSFTTDNKFVYLMEFSDGSSTLISGDYLSEGLSLSLTGTNKIELEPGKVPKNTSGKYGLFESASYTIEGQILTIKYISYPADAPVDTFIRYRRKTTPGGGAPTP